MAKGFISASLRNIVKEAGVTTGAFYGYYQSKEALFRALTEPSATVFMNRYTQAQQSFIQLAPEDQINQMGEISGDCMDWMVSYIYENFDIFKLILCCSQGTEYEHFIHTLVEIEVDATHRFVSVLQSLGYSPKCLNPQLEHLLISGQFSAFFEMVIHDMPQDQAYAFIHDLRTFYTAGWRQILGL